MICFCFLAGAFALGVLAALAFGALFFFYDFLAEDPLAFPFAALAGVSGFAGEAVAAPVAATVVAAGASTLALGVLGFVVFGALAVLALGALGLVDFDLDLD